VTLTALIQTTVSAGAVFDYGVTTGLRLTRFAPAYLSKRIKRVIDPRCPAKSLTNPFFRLLPESLIRVIVALANPSGVGGTRGTNQADEEPLETTFCHFTIFPLTRRIVYNLPCVTG
jgi:hypothetical protein